MEIFIITRKTSKIFNELFFNIKFFGHLIPTTCQALFCYAAEDVLSAKEDVWFELQKSVFHNPYCYFVLILDRYYSQKTGYTRRNPCQKVNWFVRSATNFVTSVYYLLCELHCNGGVLFCVTSALLSAPLPVLYLAVD